MVRLVVGPPHPHAQAPGAVLLCVALERRDTRREGCALVHVKGDRNCHSPRQGRRFPRPALPFFDLSWPLSGQFACLGAFPAHFRLEMRREPPSAPKEPFREARVTSIAAGLDNNTALGAYRITWSATGFAGAGLRSHAVSGLLKNNTLAPNGTHCDYPGISRCARVPVNPVRRPAAPRRPPGRR